MRREQLRPKFFRGQGGQAAQGFHPNFGHMDEGGADCILHGNIGKFGVAVCGSESSGASYSWRLHGLANKKIPSPSPGKIIRRTRAGGSGHRRCPG
jgi:hypothetical protein